jgi:hypothetical protein
MARKNMVHGLSTINSLDKFCEECVIGKYLRSSFSKVAEYRIKKPLELVHTNIYGSIKPSSIDEN